MTIQWLLAWYNLIFILPLFLALLYVGIYAVSGLTFGDTDVDAGGDVDAEGHFELHDHLDAPGHVETHFDADSDADLDSAADAAGHLGADAHDACRVGHGGEPRRAGSAFASHVRGVRRS